METAKENSKYVLEKIVYLKTKLILQLSSIRKLNYEYLSVFIKRRKYKSSAAPTSAAWLL